jgi:hypothetical protein
VHELEDQLAAAAARETLLQDSIAAREDTIRCTARSKHMASWETATVAVESSLYCMFQVLDISNANPSTAAAGVHREKDGMLAMLQSRLELLVAPCPDSGALVALPWRENSDGAVQQADLAAAHAAACRRAVELEGAVNSLKVRTVRWHNTPITQLHHGLATLTPVTSMIKC